LFFPFCCPADKGTSSVLVFLHLRFRRPIFFLTFSVPFSSLHTVPGKAPPTSTCVSYPGNSGASFFFSYFFGLSVCIDHFLRGFIDFLQYYHFLGTDCTWRVFFVSKTFCHFDRGWYPRWVHQNPRIFLFSDSVILFLELSRISRSSLVPGHTENVSPCLLLLQGPKSPWGIFSQAGLGTRSSCVLPGKIFSFLEVVLVSRAAVPSSLPRAFPTLIGFHAAASFMAFWRPVFTPLRAGYFLTFPVSCFDVTALRNTDWAPFPPFPISDFKTPVGTPWCRLFFSIVAHLTKRFNH